MTGAKPRRRLSIFARTFLVLAIALVLAQGVGVGLILMRTPIFATPVHPPEILALLSTRMPAANADLQVSTQSSPPEAPAGHHRDHFIERLIAHWLGMDVKSVRFYREGRPPAFLSVVQEDGDRAPMAPPRIDSRGEAGDDFLPHGRPFEDPSPLYDIKGIPDEPWHEMPVPGFSPSSPLLAGFTAAAQQPDGTWRVVTAPGRQLSGAFKFQVAALFCCGLLLMLPLAWRFSRALSAPIRRFSEAADQLGRNPDAPPLERSGPAELVQAADSFNAMQARLNRMMHERTQMVAAIAHDLRTPLARLAFRMEAAPEALREKTLADIDEMKAMISAALDFIKNDARRGQRSRVDFQLLVESVVDNLADTGADARLVPGDSVDVEGDPLALRRMVTNLVENALKYGKRARVQVHRNGDQCLLWVDDDGPGIDPAQREHLLLPFVRGESSRNRDTGGIGLGLAVANSIVLAHGGQIDLDNRPEGGLRVTVQLPCHEA
ncbi:MULTISPECIES: ATP-binding protein [Gammaproteobacteria]|uniref:ATP-binding protein n=1 Tax=Gammaproteobacteria TaxID=1236 RepID=UPI00112E8EF9|nr:ATP-binding protein [Pseudomonas sp. Hp2]